VVALQLAVSGLVLPAQSANIDPERALMNSSLPAPFITPRQVAQIMKAPTATTSGIKSGKGLSSDVIGSETRGGKAAADIQATTLAEPTVANGPTESTDSAVATAQADQAEGGWPTATESGADDATDAQQLAFNVVPGGVPGTFRFGPNGPIIIDNDEDIE